MRTNLEKYNHYLELLNERCRQFVNEIFKDNMPEKFFRINGKHALQECEVTGIDYSTGFWTEIKPTKVDIERVKDAYENAKLTIHKIFIRYRIKSDSGQIIGSERFVDFSNHPTLSWTLEGLQDELKRRKELYEPREGYIPCSYCGIQNPPENIIYSAITYRAWNSIQRKSTVQTIRQPYCKDKPCASYDQMAHEG